MRKYIITLFFALFSIDCVNAQSTEDKLVKLLEEKVKLLEEQVNSLNKNKTSMEETNVSLNNLVNSQRTEIETQKKEIEKLKSEKNTRYDRCKKENEDLGNNIKKLEKEIDSLKVDLQNKKTEIDNLKDTIVGYKKKNQEYESSINKFEKDKERFTREKNEFEKSLVEGVLVKEELDVFIIDVIIACLDNPCKKSTIEKLSGYYNKISSDSIRKANEKFADILSIYTETKESIIKSSQQCLTDCDNQTSSRLKFGIINQYIASIRELKYVKTYSKDNTYYSIYLNGLIPEQEIKAYEESAGDTKLRETKANELLDALRKITSE